MNIHFLNYNVKCMSLSNEKCMSAIHSLAKIYIHSKIFSFDWKKVHYTSKAKAQNEVEIFSEFLLAEC